MTVETKTDDPRDQFPVGMRVLAVDDDPTCLLVLENLLRHCQYHVTTTNQATTALKMLRENKNKFDLVISDVYMPDMDGFKLLELVGLEMDLPVIMLSANGDSKLVMKGITHGACDYLLKPVRIEELKNIWQHVIRRKKFDSKDQRSSGNQDKHHNESGEEGTGPAGTGIFYQNGKLNKKRKDQNEDDDDENDEDGHDSDDPLTQKKPRVVWSVELHRKFVAAVNQLGIDKAVPKKILDLMNVEKLTRENVASHLQKYRLYLKRISCVANQQSNMVAALGSSDSSYLRMGSMNGIGNLHSLSGSANFNNTPFRSFPSGGMIGRLNSPAGLSMRSLKTSEMIQLGHAQNYRNSTDQLKFHPFTLPGNQNGSVRQGMPMSLELDQQHSRNVPPIGEFSTGLNDPTIFPISSGLPDAKVTANSSNSAFGVSNSTLLVGNSQATQGGRRYGNQPFVSLTSLKSEFCSPLLDHGKCTDDWSNSSQSTAFQSNSVSFNDHFKQPTTLLSSSLRDTMPVMASQIGSNQFDASSVVTVSNKSPDSRTDIQSQAVAANSNTGQTINNVLVQGWNSDKQDYSYYSNVMSSSVSSFMPLNRAMMSPLEPNPNSNNSIFNKNLDFNSIGLADYVDPLNMKYDEAHEGGKSIMETSLRLKQGYLKDQQTPQGSISNNFGSLEDLVTVMMQEQDKTKSMEGNFDPYALGTSM